MSASENGERGAQDGAIVRAMNEATTYFASMKSPVGPLTLASNGGALCAVQFGDETPAGWVRDERPLRDARRQLEEYFAGTRTAFDLPLAMRGTPFQMRVWQALREIPFGVTASYGEIARRIGAPHASRAVGGANHRNPVAIIVPCHRVIGADGSLTGYGGGEACKRALLDLERGGDLFSPRRSGVAAAPATAPRGRPASARWP